MVDSVHVWHCGALPRCEERLTAETPRTLRNSEKTSNLVYYDARRSAYSTREEVMAMLETVLKGFEEADEIRVFEKGRFELVRIGGMTIGRATYQPGWKWSVHVGPSLGASRCKVEHVGLVLSGCATAAMEDGTIHELRAGMLFYIPPGPPGHDSWVVGDTPYVSLHFLGADSYANK